MPKILIACEQSGIVRDAFIRQGLDAVSVDILSTDSSFGPHITGDVLDVLDMGWDLMVAFPPCTYLSFVANRVWNVPGRAELREQAVEFFMKLVNAPIDRIAIENPVGHMQNVYRKYDQIVHPWYFGDNYKKRTCLWLKNLPKLVYTNVFPKPEPLYRLSTTGAPVNYIDGMTGPDRQKRRSIFHPGMAAAMAEQWGALLA